MAKAKELKTLQAAFNLYDPYQKALYESALLCFAQFFHIFSIIKVLKVIDLSDKSCAKGNCLN